MIDESKINFYVAEVESYVDTYKQNDSGELFLINVQVKQNNNLKRIIDVKPANNNIKQIPIIGENVLIFQGYNQNTSYLKREHQWYYLNNIAIQSSTNNNILPIISPEFKPDAEFKDTAVSPLQPYRGDLLIEGRWGNTIRLGSTSANLSDYSVSPEWSGNVKTDPIITLSNGQVTKSGKQFTVENLEKDASSLYLTSTQKFTNFKLNNIIRTSDSETAFNGSQFIGIADRVTLKSKSDIIVLDSKSAVEINTPLLSIGKKPNFLKEYGLHSEQVKELFDTIIDILNFGLLAGNIPVTINPALKSLFDTQIRTAKNKIDNKLIKQDKA